MSDENQVNSGEAEELSEEKLEEVSGGEVIAQAPDETANRHVRYRSFAIIDRT